MTVSVCVRSLPALVELVNTQGTQRELARKIGMSATAINLLLQGRRDTVRVDTAARVEDALGVDRGTLFVFTDVDLVSPYTRRDAA
ncbi:MULTISPECIES: helix-turn-helix domain-containing protein [Amycolatopsis]|uniref:helix-turn-helix domain-containing protein n=1 Tax=Amycolatopsis TaxID=1813 RepID=UPI00366A2869